MRHPILTIALCATGLFIAAASPAGAQDEPKPAAPAAAGDVKPGAPAKRTPEQIQGDLEKAGGELQSALGTPETLIDPAKRKAAAAKAIPAIKRMSALLDEVVQIQPEARDDIESGKLEFLTMLCIFGDAESAKALDALAKGTDKKAVDAQAGQQFVAYIAATKDEAGQLKALDEVQKLAKANPKNDGLANTLMKMSKMAPASKAVTERAETILTTDLTGPAAKEIGERVKGERKMRESVGKPVEIAGPKVDGKAFSTKDWKGKVILIDFWATWCGPCLQEMPRVKKAYIEYHAKGLEVLGVSCDTDGEALKGFLAQRNDMPWPQLWDAAQNPKLEWHPIAKSWGINGIPTMFLIDRKGVLRSVEARGEFEETIPKLIEEKAE